MRTTCCRLCVDESGDGQEAAVARVPQASVACRRVAPESAERGEKGDAMRGNALLAGNNGHRIL